MTFEPHPMVRGRMVTAKLRGFIDEDIPEGTRLVLSSYKSGFSMLPGPKFDVCSGVECYMRLSYFTYTFRTLILNQIDVCQFIRDSFPDAPTPIQCPLNQWAIKLVLLSLQRKEEEAARNRDEYDDFEIVADGESDAGDDTKTMSSGNKASATQQGNGTQAMTFRVPRFMIRGSYRSRLTLVTGDNRVLTCAETELVVV